MSAWMTEYKTRWQKFILHFSLIFRIHCGVPSQWRGFFHAIRTVSTGKFNSLIFFCNRIRMQCKWRRWRMSKWAADRERANERERVCDSMKSCALWNQEENAWNIGCVIILTIFCVWIFSEWRESEKRAAGASGKTGEPSTSFRWWLGKRKRCILFVCRYTVHNNKMLMPDSSQIPATDDLFSLTFFSLSLPLFPSLFSSFSFTLLLVPELTARFVAIHGLKSFEPLSIVVILKWNSCARQKTRACERTHRKRRRIEEFSLHSNDIKWVCLFAILGNPWKRTRIHTLK